MNIFYGSKFIEESILKDCGKNTKIKIEYYKKVNITSNKIYSYGILIVMKEYILKKLKIETKSIDNLTENEDEIEKFLEILKTHDVTPVSVEYIIQDLENQYFKQHINQI